MAAKKTKRASDKFQKVTKREAGKNYNDKRPIWTFDKLDLSDSFSFTAHKLKTDNNFETVFTKMLEYSQMTWAEIARQTHDNGSSKHHYLSDESKFSKEAFESINGLGLSEQSDQIYSFALTNKLRIIGIRNNEYFQVVWYDPDHRFYPAKKKHT